MKRRTVQPIVIANWKMHPDTKGLARTLARNTVSQVLRARTPEVEVVIMPPSIYIPEVALALKGKPIALGVQDAFPEKTAPETGAVSFSMAKEFYVRYVIVGHSEMRARGEQVETIAAKVQGAINAGVTPILCVGEVERDTDGQFFDSIHTQLETALINISARKAENLVIAYEPVWAIGSGNTPTEHELSEMRLYILKYLTKRFNATVARKIRVLYGGSVSPENASELITHTEMDGFLIGGASRDPQTFARIVAVVATQKK